MGTSLVHDPPSSIVQPFNPPFVLRDVREAEEGGYASEAARYFWFGLLGASGRVRSRRPSSISGLR